MTDPDPTGLDYDTATELQANKLAEAKNTAAQAKNWVAGLTTLTGLAATVTILKGSAEKTAELNPVQFWLATLLSLASLAFLILGVGRAYVAAYGSPGLRQITLTPLAGLHARMVEAITKAAEESAKALRFAIGFTITGVVLLVLASVTSWVPIKSSQAGAKSVCIFSGDTKVAEVNAGSVDLKSLAAGSRLGPCS